MKKLNNLPLATHWKIHLISSVLGIFIGLISSQFGTDVNAGMIIGFILMIGGIVWHIVFIKCPHCGHHFNIRMGLPNHCPNCGEKVV